MIEPSGRCQTQGRHFQKWLVLAQLSQALCLLLAFPPREMLIVPGCNYVVIYTLPLQTKLIFFYKKLECLYIPWLPVPS